MICITSITREQEFVAIVNTMQTWRCYLEGLNCAMMTNHNPLVYLETKHDLSRCQAQWLTFLDFFYISGYIAF